MARSPQLAQSQRRIGHPAPHHDVRLVNRSRLRANQVRSCSCPDPISTGGAAATATAYVTIVVHSRLQVAAHDGQVAQILVREVLEPQADVGVDGRAFPLLRRAAICGC
jgi:hypothetical protein